MPDMPLTDSLIALALLGLLSSLALPSWQWASTRSQLKTRAQSLIADVQWAQWQAIRLAEPVVIAPLACSTSASAMATPSPDWSCGWQISNAKAQVLRQRDLNPQIRMQAFTTQSPWQFDAQGRWRSGAMRVQWSLASQPSGVHSELGITVCVSNTGRWRWQSGLGCNT